MRHLNSKSAFPAILLSVICYLLSVISCQTASKITETIVFDEITFLPLDSGAFVYMLADVPNARPLLNYLKFIDTDDKQLQQMINQTQFAAAATYLPNSARRYQLSAWGNYPASKAKMALGASAGWKKFRSSITGAEYWYSEGLSVAVNPRQIFVTVSSSNDPDIPIDPFAAAPGTVVPEGFNTFRKGAVLSCWIENPSSLINKKIAEMGITFELPAEQILVSLFPAPAELVKNPPRTGEEQLYQARLRIEFPGAAQARMLTSLFSLARNFLPVNANTAETDPDNTATLAAILFAAPPVQDDKYLIITSNAISGREIALLFNMFSL